MKDKNQNKISLSVSELLYYLYFAVMLCAKGLGLYDGQALYTLSLVTGAVLIIMRVLTTRHTVRELIVIGVLLILAGIIYVHSDQFAIFILVATVAGMKDISVERVMKLGCVIWVVTFTISAGAALLGLRPDIFMAQDKLGLGHILRWSLGQPHPNVLQISFTILCAFLFYIFKPRGKTMYLMTLGCLLGSIYIFMYSISFTGIALSVMYLFINLYLSEWRGQKSLHIIEKACMAIVLPISLLFAILGPNLFTGRLWEICNKLLNTRFYITQQYMSFNPISLFGSGYCNELPGDLNNLDSSYVFALMHYGIIFFVLFFAAYELLILYQIRNDRRNELAITLTLAVAAISEPFFVNPSFKNISLIFLGSFLFTLSKSWDEKHPESILCRQVCLIKPGDRRLELPTKSINTFISYIRAAYRKNTRLLVIIASVIAIVCGIAVAKTKQMPGAYYLNRSRVQIISKGVFLDIDNLPEDFDGEFLEYTDSETPMIRLDGNAVRLEYVRAVVSSVVWCGLIVYMAEGVGIVIYEARRKNNNNCTGV